MSSEKPVSFRHAEAKEENKKVILCPNPVPFSPGTVCGPCELPKGALVLRLSLRMVICIPRPFQWLSRHLRILEGITASCLGKFKSPQRHKVAESSAGRAREPQRKEGDEGEGNEGAGG